LHAVRREFAANGAITAAMADFLMNVRRVVIVKGLRS